MLNVHDSLFVREHASVPAHREHLPHSWRRVSRFRREQIIDLLSKGKKIEADGRLMTDPGHPKYLGVSKKKGLLPEEIETISTFVLEQVLCFQRATNTHTCSTFSICVDEVVLCCVFL